MSPTISVVLPAHNEAACLPGVLEELSRIEFGQSAEIEIIVVNDGSTDESSSVLACLQKRYQMLQVVTLPFQQGKTAALKAGVQRAQGPLIATQDADGEDDPNYLPQMIEVLESGADLVCAKRRHRSHPLHKRILSHGFNLLIKAILRIDVKDVNSGLKIGRREVWQSIPFERDFHRFIPVFAKHHGFSITEFEVIHRTRIAGRSKYRGDRYIRALVDLVIVFYVIHFCTLRAAPPQDKV